MAVWPNTHCSKTWILNKIMASLFQKEKSSVANKLFCDLISYTLCLKLLLQPNSKQLLQLDEKQWRWACLLY